MSNIALIVNNVLSNSGVTLASKADLVNGLVPANQLPSYVDDVLEFANLAAFPATGETAKIYVALDTNETYRWSGSAYVRIANGAVQSVNTFTGNVTLTTTNIGEGTNQYFTNARARSAISVSGSLSYNASTGVLSYTQPTNVSAFTNDAAYITTAGARSAISVSGSLSYNSTTGVISYTQPTNVSAFSNDSGYITTAQARAAISVTGSLSYNSTTGVISYTQPTNISAFTNDSGYITTAGARSALSFAAGSGAYNSTTGVITIPTNTNQLTNGAGFITGYTETDTLASVTGRGSTTSTAITISASTDQLITLNATDSSWTYLGFSWAGARRGYFGLNASGELNVGSDTAQPFRVTGGGGMTVDGSVGIGTTSPNHRLDVNGDINIPGTNKLVFNNEPTGWYIHARTTTSTSNLGSALKNIIISGGGSTEGLAFTGVGTGATAMEVRNDGFVWVRSRLHVGEDVALTRTDSDFGFITRPNTTGYKKIGFLVSGGGNLTDFWVYSDTSYFSGNVGIGSTSLYHSAKLSVAGKVHFQTSSNTDIGGAIYSTWTQSANGTDFYAGDLRFQIFNASSGTYGLRDAMMIDGKGFVGIGTITPSKQLHVLTTNNEGIYLQGTGGGVWMDIKSAAGRVWSYGAQNDGCGIYDRTSNIYRLFIADGGSMTVGGTNASVFTVANNGSFTSGGGSGSTFNISYGGQNIATLGNTGTGQRDAVLTLRDEGTARVVIAANNARGGNTYFNGGGNVGIGTQTPGAPLEIYRDAANADVTGGGIVFSRYQISGDYRGSAIFHRYITSGNAFDAMVFTVSEGSNPYISGTTALDNRVKMVLTQAGRLGVGTVSPTYRLHVVGSTDLINATSTSTDARINIGHSGNGGYVGYANIASGNASNTFYVTTGSGSIGSGICMNNAGRVSIGTTAEDVGKQLYLTGAFRANVSSGGANATDRCTIYDTNGSQIDLVSYVAGGEAYSGSMGMFINGGKDALIMAGNANIRFVTGGYTEVARCTNAQEFLIGYTSDQGAYKLQVNGAIYASGDIVAFSDISVKDNIRSIEKPVERLIKSRGVLYDRTDTKEKDNIGFIAQELEKEFPELVTQNADGTKAVRYQNMVAVLTEAIKEQQSQIESQKSEIEELKELVKQLINK